MSLQIAQLGQPVLRQVAAEVGAEERASAEFRQLVAEMEATLREEEGAGLAAPQVFQSKRMFLARVEPLEEGAPLPPPVVFINPRIVGASVEQAAAWEGCLSFRELLVKVTRPLAVRIEFLDLEGAARALDLHGFPARVVQHELDHLDGVLTIDRAQTTLHIIKASEIAAVKGVPPPSP
jgi:peptide deformylase